MNRHLASVGRGLVVLGLTELLTRTVVALGVIASVAYLGSTEAVVGAITSNPAYVPRAIATTSLVGFFDSREFTGDILLVLIVYLLAFSASFRLVFGEWWGSWTDRIADAPRERFDLATEPELEDLDKLDMAVGLGVWIVAFWVAMLVSLAVLEAWYRVLVASPVALIEYLVVVVPSFLFAMWVGDVVLPELLNRTGFGRVEP